MTLYWSYIRRRREEGRVKIYIWINVITGNLVFHHHMTCIWKLWDCKQNGSPKTGSGPFTDEASRKTESHVVNKLYLNPFPVLIYLHRYLARVLEKVSEVYTGITIMQSSSLTMVFFVFSFISLVLFYPWVSFIFCLFVSVDRYIAWDGIIRVFLFCFRSASMRSSVVVWSPLEIRKFYGWTCFSFAGCL